MRKAHQGMVGFRIETSRRFKNRNTRNQDDFLKAVSRKWMVIVLRR